MNIRAGRSSTMSSVSSTRRRRSAASIPCARSGSWTAISTV
jgi:hypothetical protein